MYGTYPKRLFISNEICYHMQVLCTVNILNFSGENCMRLFHLGNVIFTCILLLFTNVSSLFQCENTKKAILKSHQRIHNFSNEIVDHCHVGELMFYYFIFHMILYSHIYNVCMRQHSREIISKNCLANYIFEEISFHEHYIIIC